MNEQQWKQACCDVGQQMALHTEPFVASINQEISATEGRLVGTGTYLRLRGHPYILTNWHVACEMLNGSLGHLLKKGESAFTITNPFQCLIPPTDAAIARVDREQFDGSDRLAVSASRVARAFHTPPNELLFIHGFPQERSRMSGLLEGLISRSLPYVTRGMSSPVGYPEIYFLVPYPYGVLLPTLDGKEGYLPDPHGMSGSLVWDTGLMAANNQSWKPDAAHIVGVVQGWDQNNHALVAVKIEFVRQFLVRALREEAAYFRWLARDQPVGEALDDWSWAEHTITDIV